VGIDWEVEKIITGSDTQQGDKFRIDLDISEDGNWLVVGAKKRDGNSADEGCCVPGQFQSIF